MLVNGNIHSAWQQLNAFDVVKMICRRASEWGRKLWVRMVSGARSGPLLSVKNRKQKCNTHGLTIIFSIWDWINFTWAYKCELICEQGQEQSFYFKSALNTSRNPFKESGWKWSLYWYSGRASFIYIATEPHTTGGPGESSRLKNLGHLEPIKSSEACQLLCLLFPPFPFPVWSVLSPVGYGSKWTSFRLLFLDGGG